MHSSSSGTTRLSLGSRSARMATGGITYVVALFALGMLAFRTSGAGTGDLFPGAAFLVLTFPVSLLCIVSLPKQWLGTVLSNPVALIVLPTLNAMVLIALWKAVKGASTVLTRRRS